MRGRDRLIVDALSHGAPKGEGGSAAQMGGEFLVSSLALQQSGVSRAVAGRALALLALASAAVGLRSLMAGAGLLAAGLLVGGGRVLHLAKRRREAVERDLPAFLATIASSVRAGMDPVSAIMGAETFFPQGSPLRSGISEFTRGMHDGGSEEEAIAGFMGPLSSPDLELFKRCLTLSRRHGGPLAEPLHRVVKVVRQRQSFRRKTRAALAMHRMSAAGIALCASLLGVIQGCMNVSGLSLAWHHPVGGAFLLLGGALVSVGIVWMMLLGREETL